jgi:hypothetical protein
MKRMARVLRGENREVDPNPYDEGYSSYDGFSGRRISKDKPWLWTKRYQRYLDRMNRL